MRATLAASSRRDGAKLGSPPRAGSLTESLAGLVAIVVLVAGWFSGPMAQAPAETGSVAGETSDTAGKATDVAAGKEYMAAFYAGAPVYHRSDVHLTRPDGTDLLLKDLGWDGDAFYFPIDGGIRVVRWASWYGGMIDFLHNKAIARLGMGSHGRKISNPVIEEVETSGTLKGKPAPERLKLTDLFERLEFTHGHNVLLFTGLARLGGFTGQIRPYVGAGFGPAIPHTEVRFVGETQRTNEYQYAGPAWQVLFGLELRTGRFSYFLEYKYTGASISGALTGDSSWLNYAMPGDLWRQFRRYWTGEEPKYGRIATSLNSHQGFFGVGYWLKGRVAAP